MMYIVNFQLELLLFIIFVSKRERKRTQSWVNREVRRIGEGFGEGKHDQNILNEKFFFSNKNTLWVKQLNSCKLLHFVLFFIGLQFNS